MSYAVISDTGKKWRAMVLALADGIGEITHCAVGKGDATFDDYPDIGDPIASAGNTGDDTAASGGTYSARTNESYLVKVTKGGAEGVAEITVTGQETGDDSGPTVVTLFGSGVAIGTKGATITFTDGGDNVLVLDDQWMVFVTAVKPEDAESTELVSEFARKQYWKKAYLIEDELGSLMIGNQNYTEVTVLGDPVADGGNTGDDTAASAGGYFGVLDEDYLVEVTKGGAAGTAEITVTGQTSGDDSGPTVVSVFGADIPVGTLGAIIRFTDGGDSVLTLGDKWTISAPYYESKFSAYFFKFLEDEANAERIVEFGFFAHNVAYNTAKILAAIADGGNTGDDTAASGGTYTGLANETYEVEVTTGGAPGAGAAITVTGLQASDDSGPTAVAAFGTPVAIGTKGATITFTDGGDTNLTLGDKWLVACTKNVAGTYAENGIYNRSTNDEGEVAVGGVMYKIKHVVDPEKDNTRELNFICLIKG